MSVFGSVSHPEIEGSNKRLVGRIREAIASIDEATRDVGFANRNPSLIGGVLLANALFEIQDEQRHKNDSQG